MMLWFPVTSASLTAGLSTSTRVGRRRNPARLSVTGFATFAAL
jgi:hypothetical protein